MTLITYDRCCRCPEPVAGSIEVFVMTPPAGSDKSGYAIFLRGLWAKHPNRWIRLPFCHSHLQEQIERGELEFENEGKWKADHPDFFIAEPKLVKLNGKAIQAD